jgi:hypothetical protein
MRHQPIGTTQSVLKFHSCMLLKNKELSPNVAVYAPRLARLAGNFYCLIQPEGTLLYEHVYEQLPTNPNAKAVDERPNYWPRTLD